MNENYNWRNTLRDFAYISGILAGFCVTFIGLVLGQSLANVRLFGDITFGNVSVLFLGFSTVLFISAFELLLHSKNYDVFEWSEDYHDWLIEGMPKKDLGDVLKESNKKIKVFYEYGIRCYSVAIIMLYLGLFFALSPYNLFIAFSIFILGMTLRLFQNKSEIFSKISSLRVKAVLLICVLLMALLIGCYFGYILGRNDVVSKIKHHIDVSLELSSSDVLTQLKQDFPEKLNYTQLLAWESTKLKYTLKRQVHTNPIDIKNYGKGACGEFSILYTAICLANDIPARLVTDAVVDHV